MMTPVPLSEQKARFPVECAGLRRDPPRKQLMDEIHPVPDHVLRRLPGLFRRWELAQVIEPNKDYHVEDAGSASDGTTLYAVYASEAVAPPSDVETTLHLAPRAGAPAGRCRT